VWLEGLSKLKNPPLKNCFVKCDFSVDHVSSNDGRAVNLVKTKRMTGRSVDQVLDQNLTSPEEDPEEVEEVTEHKTTFLDALKALKQPESICVNLIPRKILL
jgi:hypothetical protein